uniref:NADH dehydrogenase subunit 4 n=1 Tax=Laemobothrion atrum TaxID=179170 RepID=UPI00257B069C|nr:NADH dehydrogenase subunit 4 [Laemobothrion atrum]WGU50349.1 NADH dehydrogenase subunit 4 [Laemobothrion atrum]
MLLSLSVSSALSLLLSLPLSEVFLLFSLPLILAVSVSKGGVVFLSPNYAVDFLSSAMVLLTFWVAIFLLSSKNSGMMNLSLLLLVFVMSALFMSNSFLSLFIFYEFSLIPTVYLIVGWGYQPERLSASLYLFFYTLVFSLPLLGFCIYFSLESWKVYEAISSESGGMNPWVSTLALLSFMVKMPLFGIHFWLPKAHVEAPMQGSVMLAAVLLKGGGYGLIRVIKLTNIDSMKFFFTSLSSVGMVSAAIAVLLSLDLKTMVALSSVSHMNFSVLGMLTLTLKGMEGAILMMVAHSLISSVLFFLVNMNYEVFFSRSMFMNKLIMSRLPKLSMIWFMALALNLGLPPFLLMVGELLMTASIMSFMWVGLGLLLYMYFLMSGIYNLNLFNMISHGWGQLMEVPSQQVKVSDLFIVLGWLVPLLPLLLSVGGAISS